MKLKIVIISMLISYVGFSQQPANKIKSPVAKQKFGQGVYKNYSGGGYITHKVELGDKTVQDIRKYDEEVAANKEIQLLIAQLAKEDSIKRVQDLIKKEKHKEALRVQAKLELVKKELELKKQENIQNIVKILSYFLLAIISIGLYFIILKVKTSVNFNQLTNTFTTKVKTINLNTFKFKLSDKEIIVISICIGIISAIVIGNYLYPVEKYKYGHKYTLFDYPIGIICFIVNGGMSYLVLNKIKKP